MSRLTESEYQQLLFKHPLRLGCEPAIAVTVERLKELLSEERELTQAREDVRVLTEALEFYAEKRLYVNIGVRADLYADQGERAREAILKTQTKE